MWMVVVSIRERHALACLIGDPSDRRSLEWSLPAPVLRRNFVALTDFGLLWIAATAAQILVQGLAGVVKSRALLLRLCWHFPDLIWIGIFTVVFLRGMA